MNEEYSEKDRKILADRLEIELDPMDPLFMSMVYLHIESDRVNSANARRKALYA